MVNALIAGFSLLVAIAIPFVAYPLAQVVKKGRQAIDNMLNWRGANAKVFEEIEDGLTYLSSFLVIGAVMIIVGAIYTWYVQMVVLPVNSWLGAYVWSNFPVVGNEVIGDYNVAIILYWSVVYLTVFIIGWTRAGKRR